MNRHFVALSGLAIVIVVLNHSIHMGTLGIQEMGLPQAQGLERLLLVLLSALGTFAVPTFLFTSGSFVSYAAQRTPPRLPWKTVWAALKRLLWPYLFWSIVFYIYVYFRKAEGYTLWGYVQNLIVGYPFHFIPILLFYYACSPVLVRLTGRFGYVLIAGIALYQAFLIGLIFPSTYGISVPDWTEVLVPPVLGRPMAQWGIFFPLGLIYSLKAKEISPWLQRFKVAFVVATGGLFVLLILDGMSVLRFPGAGYLCPVAFLLFAPTIKRDSIPLVRQLEKVARKSYGLYLTNLLVLDLCVVSTQILVPGLLGYPLLFCLILFAVALAVPLVVMNAVVRTPARAAYHYVFG
jgi:fucose 4-O-acetylase-like acetyltransferase